MRFDIIKEPEKWTNKQKKVIAKKYADLHRPHYKPFYGLLSIFENLIGGVYGEVREESKGEYQIEIGRHESLTGNPVIFEFSEGD